MKNPKTLFDQAIEIIEAGGDVLSFLNKSRGNQSKFLLRVFMCSMYDWMDSIDWSKKYTDEFTYTRLLLARELWNDGQEKYWKQGLFK